MGDQSAITHDLAVDDPVKLAADFRFDEHDRRYLDNQVRGMQIHLCNLLILGIVGTIAIVEGSSPALSAGDWVCLSSLVSSNRRVTRATAAALAKAGAGYGICLNNAAPGSNVMVAIIGAVPASLVGLDPPGATGYARISLSTARTEYVALPLGGDYIVGVVDTIGNVTLSRLPIATGDPLTGAASNDLSGIYPGPVVERWKGTRILTPGGALLVGQVIRATDVDKADWGPLDLANASSVTGILPVANLPAAAIEKNVANVAALALVDTATFTDLAKCTVRTLLDTWTLIRADSRTPNGITIVAAKSGAATNGNWVRDETHHPDWLLVTDWYVTSGGNDEALGDATHQLASPEEVLRRIGTDAKLPAATTLHIQSTLSSTKPLDIPRSVKVPLGLTIVGTPTQVATGTLTFFANCSATGATKYKVTDTGLAGGFGPHVGRLMRLNTGAYFFIGADLGGGIAEISTPGSSVPGGGVTSQLFAAFTQATPAVGNTYEILTLPQVTVRAVVPDGPVYSTFIDYRCSGLGGVAGYISACKIDNSFLHAPGGTCVWSQVYETTFSAFQNMRMRRSANWHASAAGVSFKGCDVIIDFDDMLVGGGSYNFTNTSVQLLGAAAFDATFDGFQVDHNSTMRIPGGSNNVWGTNNARAGVFVRGTSKVIADVGQTYHCNRGLGALREVLLGDRFVLYNMLPARAINSAADWGEIRSPF